MPLKSAIGSPSVNCLLFCVVGLPGFHNATLSGTEWVPDMKALQVT